MVCFFQQSWEADLGRHIDMSVHVGSLWDMQDESEIGRYVEKEEFLSIFSFVSRYVAKHRVVGRAKIQRLLNPSALFDLNEKQVQGFCAGAKGRLDVCQNYIELNAGMIQEPTQRSLEPNSCFTCVYIWLCCLYTSLHACTCFLMWLYTCLYSTCPACNLY